MGKPWVSPNTGCFFKLVTVFGWEEIGTQKIKKQFFSNMLYPLKAHAHYFYVFIYLFKVWTHWSMYTIYRSPADHRRDHTSSYYHHPKNFCIAPWWVFVCDFGISTNKGRVSTPQKSRNFLEDQEKKFEIIRKKLGESNGKKILSMQLFTF